jgi:hypothetical protein
MLNKPIKEVRMVILALAFCNVKFQKRVSVVVKLPGTKIVVNLLALLLVFQIKILVLRF